MIVRKPFHFRIMTESKSATTVPKEDSMTTQEEELLPKAKEKLPLATIDVSDIDVAKIAIAEAPPEEEAPPEKEAPPEEESPPEAKEKPPPWVIDVTGSSDSEEDVERVYHLIDLTKEGDIMGNDDSSDSEVYHLMDVDGKGVLSNADGEDPPGLTDGTDESEYESSATEDEERDEEFEEFMDETDDEDNERSPRGRRGRRILGGFAYALNLLLIWHLVAATLVNGLVVYDCNDPRTDIGAYDLINPAACVDADTEYEYPITQSVQLIQTDIERPIRAKRCRIKITKEVTRGGFNGVTYASQWPVFEEILPVTQEECIQIWKTGKVTFAGGKHTVKIIRGATVTTTWISHGSISANAMCYEEKQFVSGGKTFFYSYETTLATIDISTVLGTVDLYGIIRLPSGLMFNEFHDGSVMDNHEGRIVWVAAQPKCEQRLSNVYYGNATLRTKKGPLTNNTYQELEGAVLMLNDYEEERTAGLVLKKPVRLCGKQCHSTQIVGLSACLLRGLDTPLVNTTFLPQMDARAANIQTQIGFLHLSSSLREEDRFRFIQNQICALERKGLYTKLQVAAEGNNRYAFLDVFGIGHSLMSRGASVYVSRCYPKNVTLAQTTNCTNEIPVMINNQTWYADPLTFVLQEFGTVEPCSEVTPVRWSIQGTWYCSTPEVKVCAAPAQLQPDIGYFQPAISITRGLGTGLWTTAQLQAHFRYTRTKNARQATLAQLTQTSVQNSHSSGSLGTVLSDQNVDELRQTLGELFFPFYSWIGTTYVIFLGIIVSICIVKIFLGGCSRTYVMWLERGCGPWILAACWATTFDIFRAPREIIRATVGAIVDQPQRDIDAARERIRRRERGDDSDDDNWGEGQDAPGWERRGRRRPFRAIPSHRPPAHAHGGNQRPWTSHWDRFPVALGRHGAGYRNEKRARQDTPSDSSQDSSDYCRTPPSYTSDGFPALLNLEGRKAVAAGNRRDRANANGRPYKLHRFRGPPQPINDIVRRFRDQNAADDGERARQRALMTEEEVHFDQTHRREMLRLAEVEVARRGSTVTKELAKHGLTLSPDLQTLSNSTSMPSIPYEVEPEKEKLTRENPDKEEFERQRQQQQLQRYHQAEHIEGMNSTEVLALMEETKMNNSIFGDADEDLLIVDVIPQQLPPAPPLPGAPAAPSLAPTAISGVSSERKIFMPGQAEKHQTAAATKKLEKRKKKDAKDAAKK